MPPYVVIFFILSLDPRRAIKDLYGLYLRSEKLNNSAHTKNITITIDNNLIKRGKESSNIPQIHNNINRGINTQKIKVAFFLPNNSEYISKPLHILKSSIIIKS